MLERRLTRQPNLKTAYHDFLRDYETSGHMTKVQHNLDQEQGDTYYIPHQAVVRENSLTTKVRVVFDASAKTSSGTALNDKLLVGPNLQQDIFEIVLRFRMYKVGLTADIAQMFRQINVAREDRQLQRILWRWTPEEEVQTYELNTVTYGTACAPYLAMRCLKQLAIDNGANYPEATPVLLNDFYMDDVLAGADSKEEAIELQKQLTELLGTGCFQLRKWRSNNSEVLTDIAEKNKEDSLMVIDKQETLKTLGLLWNADLDTLQYSVTLTESDRCTKRIVLSGIAKIYDPLGLIGPLLINAKIIMQQLWKLQMDWDESLPLEMHTKWCTYYSSLAQLEKLRIKRHVKTEHIRGKIDLHGFSDASEKGYGACIYVISYDTEGNGTSQLLCSKSKLAPIKTITLPRLELNAALLLSRLISTVWRSLGDRVGNTYLWSDSTIVLSWIKTEPRQLKTFVANRVAEIQEITKHVPWRHVPSAENPADILSRGTSVEGLLEDQLWWEGPTWVLHPEDWPKIEMDKEIDLPDMKTIINLTSMVAATHQNILHKFSSYTKLRRVFGYVWRFTQAVRKKEVGPLTAPELEEADTLITKMIQRERFPREAEDLRKGNPLHQKSQLLPLKPFLDEKGLIRVGGRLRHANLETDQKNPIVLPSKHTVTTLLMRHTHEKLHHCGPEQLLSATRQKFWPLSGRREARKVTRNCIICFRHSPKRMETIMADLPATRLTEITRPFSISGVDYAGPLQVRESRRRGRIHVAKAYIAVFTCFHTKAVHLELVSDLTSESFLAALSRFVSRRGLCKYMFSDNATNFVGANRELREIYELLSQNKDVIFNHLASKGIIWKFIPPRAPHFGGLWEAAVKATKRHLLKVIQNLTYTFEEYYTLLTEIEAILNSRPLTPLSSDPSDLSALTPSHFLIGDSLLGLPQKCYVNTPDNLLSRWKHIQKLRQHFWQRWHKEYLAQLQTRSKWLIEKANIKEGMLVLIVEDNLPPLQWPLGRVVKIHPGDDGVVRVVTLKTASGEIKRIVRKLCALPINEYAIDQSEFFDIPNVD